MFGHMPNVTPVQLIAAITWVAAQAVSAGWIDSDSSKRYVSIGSTIISSVWIAGDAVLRGFRNIRAAAEAKAGAPTP